jgi:hypothetical protein
MKYETTTMKHWFDNDADARRLCAISLPAPCKERKKERKKEERIRM